MSGEIVKYKNELNKFSFSGLTETEINIVYAIFHKFKEKNSLDICFKLDELKNLIDYSRKDLNFGDYAFETFSKLQNFKIECVSPTSHHKLLSVVVFPIIGFNRQDKEIEVNISDTIASYLNAIQDNFTRFELAEFVNLSGGYAKTLYRLLKQYRSTGWAKFDWGEFKHLMGIPDTYTKQINIDNRILKPAINELTKPRTILDSNRKPFTNLKYEKIKGAGRGRGGKVIGIKFTFDPQIDEPESEEAITLEALVGTKPQRVGDEIK